MRDMGIHLDSQFSRLIQTITDAVIRDQIKAERPGENSQFGQRVGSFSVNDHRIVGMMEQMMHEFIENEHGLSARALRITSAYDRST